MRKFVQSFLSVLALMTWSNLASANNNFSATTPIGGTAVAGTSGNLTATTVGANGQAGEPDSLPAGTTLNTMWYSWTAPATGNVTFETCSNTQTVVDTVLAAFTGNGVGTLTLLQQNDDTGGCATTTQPNFGSRVSFPVNSGSVYHLRVDGYGAGSGAFRLAWALSAFNITKAQSAGPSPITASGQTITYMISVQNAGAVALTTPTLSDTFLLNGAARTLTTGPSLTSGDAAPVGTLNVGETWNYTATYQVPLADMNGAGNFSNQATFDTAQTDPRTSNNVATVVTRTPALSLVKNFTFLTDVDSDNVADVGDVVRYTYNVSNSGNVTITGVTVADDHNGEGTLGVITPASVASLNPGTNTVFQADYTVIQADIDNQ